jgi:hypothetical protein
LRYILDEEDFKCGVCKLYFVGWVSKVDFVREVNYLDVIYLCDIYFETQVSVEDFDVFEENIFDGQCHSDSFCSL